MAVEIEHKYLVTDDSYLTLCDTASTLEIKQGYLCRVPERTVRIRIVKSVTGEAGYITVKGMTHGDTRQEYEYQIPCADALQMLEMCEGSPIVKTRYIVHYAGLKWEVDIFGGSNEGLRVAEVELGNSRHDYVLPPFVGQEVTGDPRYYNSML